MKTMTVDQAMNEALAEEMRRDARVITFGEGVATKGYQLVEEFGAKRVRNTPLAEGIIAGTAAGAGRPAYHAQPAATRWIVSRRRASA